MPRDLSLADYVQRRNGVALGARRSMRNMLWRSLGAGSFAKFWHYWNPIWGLLLGQSCSKTFNRYHAGLAGIAANFCREWLTA